MSRAKNAKEKKPTRVAAGPEAPGFARSLGETLGRALSALIPLFVIATTGGGITFGLWALAHSSLAPDVSSGTAGRRVSSAERERLTPLAVRSAFVANARPAWVSREDFEQLAAQGQFAAGRSVFEPGLSRAIAARYEANPWVARVKQVRLRYPGKLELEIEWRQPTAQVESTLMILDDQGFVLPGNAAVRNVPLIAGVQVQRTEAGRQVAEKDLLEGLQLIGVVRDALRLAPGNLRVHAVTRDTAGTWRVITDRGPAINWGYFTDDPPMDEPRTREKADLLRRRLAEVKDPALLEYISVYVAQAPVKPRAQPLIEAAPRNTGVRR